MKTFVPLIALAIGAVHGGYLNGASSRPANAPASRGWLPSLAPPQQGWASGSAPHREGWTPAPSPQPSYPPGPQPLGAPSSQPSYTPGRQPSHALAPVPVTPVDLTEHVSQPRVHEIHTQSGRQLIRLEEYNQPGQVIRIHEAPRAPPEIVKVDAPAEKAALIRVISKSSGKAHVERIVHRAPAQIIDVHRPAPAPARIVQVVRGPAPAPRVEFHYEESPAHEVHIASAPADEPLPHFAPLPTFMPAPQTITLPTPAYEPSGPIEVSSHVLPASTESHGPHTVHTRFVESSHAHSPRPAVTVSAQPTPEYNPSHASFRSPTFGLAPPFISAPSPPPKAIGRVYDAGNHMKIIKKSHR
ncbi:hypothetical protein BIW11_00284 [Tropilaelaps mercedesae]|uniref:Uncharacterized protein n=1 Tax=Tropilaelaps mercedesae TaxID=418985 RepID=A0A1V9XYP0_9ACAR|nr:hypothetical protein BIW11_00284 [Tropilaelaps mercedesae]